MEQSGETPAVDDVAEVGLARNRSRREKKDRHGRKAAFEQFREARSGQRPRYVISEEHNIYEEVDEEEYSKIVRNRQDDDWIVDDGTGYVEDGREIFDEEPEAIVTATKRKSAGTANAKPAKNPNIRPTDSKPKSIRGMFAAAAAKPKVQKTVSLEDDDILGDIMGELKKGDTQMIRPAPVKILHQVEPACLPAKTSKVEYNGLTGRAGPHAGSAFTAKKPNYESHIASVLRASTVDFNGSKHHSSKSADSSNYIKTTEAHKKSLYQLENGNTLRMSQQIQQFASQELVESDQQSEVIADFDNDMDTSAACSEVDVSGIDFNDNFEQDSPVKKLPGVM